MRLIDLDKALAEAEDECRMSDDWKVSHEMMNVFKYQPTVKAIPVEWIEKWLETCIPHYDYDKMTYIADVYEMIEDWEKENENR